MESPASNSIYVAASGVNDLREESPYRVYGVEGGFVVSRADGEGGTLRVYDLGGMTVMEENEVEDGSFHPLEAGVYVVTIGGGRPVKLVVK